MEKGTREKRDEILKEIIIKLQYVALRVMMFPGQNHMH